MKAIILQFVITLTALLPIGSANAATTLYTDETAFLAALSSPPTLESFEGLTATNTRTLTSINTTLFDISMTGGPNNFIGVYDTAFNDIHATAGTNFLVPAADVIEPLEVTLLFSQSVSAFGLNINDFGDCCGSNNLTYATNGGDSGIIASSPLASGNELFFGIVTDASFNQFTLGISTDGRDGIGLDEFYVGAAVPAPAAFWLFGSALGILGWVKRRGRTFGKST